jgi:hypothetical protein
VARRVWPRAPADRGGQRPWHDQLSAWTAADMCGGGSPRRWPPHRNDLGASQRCGAPVWLPTPAPRPGGRASAAPVRVGWEAPAGVAQGGHVWAPTCGAAGRWAIALALARAWPALGREPRFHPSAGRGMFPALVLGPPTPRSQPCLPGRAEQVWELAYGADITTWRGSGPSLVEAEARALDCLPGDGVPGRHQGLAILGGGSWPLPHHGTFQGTGPTSASPGHSPWPWLLRVSSSPAAWGWRLLREVTAAQRAAGGDAVPRSHGWPP